MKRQRDEEGQNPDVYRQKRSQRGALGARAPPGRRKLMDVGLVTIVWLTTEAH